jgi:hypothetical protein
VTGEPFKEVSPGFLPRTLDQLRAGVENDARRPENRLWRRRLTSEDERPEQPHQSLEDALDDLLLEADEIANPDVAGFTEPPTSVTPQIQEDPSEPPRPMTRPEARLQRARERFARVFGSREEQEQDDYESPLTQMYSRAYDRHRQAEERRAEGTDTAPPLDGLSQQDRREIEEQLLWGVMRESQSMSESLEPESEVWSYAPRPQRIETFPSIPGEDAAVSEARWLADQGEVDISHERIIFYETGGAEGIAAARRVVMEYHRNQEQEEVGDPRAVFYASGNEGTEAALRLIAEYHQNQAQDEAAIQAMLSSDPTAASSSTTPAPPGTQGWWSQIRPQVAGQTAEMLPTTLEEMTRVRLNFEDELARIRAARPPSPPLMSLDTQLDRPTPKTDEEMTKVLACQVCYQQIADIAVLPCGHMVMCQWCADVVVPVKHGHIPLRPTKCPMCRKQVKQRFRIHTG